MSGVRYQFEGPFDSNYSLAIVNREMARAVEALRPSSVALYSTEGPGDYAPNIAVLQQDPVIEQLWQRSQKGDAPEVSLRNLYPPRVQDMPGTWHVMTCYGWEESLFPPDYVAQFNQHLHLVAVTSQYVRKTLIDSGVQVPVVVVGDGVDHILRYPIEPVELPKQRRFTFLHISSCFPRKGVDVLLKAYSQAFSADDDVLLVIKTFPNPHNTVIEQVQTLQASLPNCPAIHVINQDYSIGQINSLYAQADALVAPSRGEGFGMPMAEAMLWEVPVITTGFGGQSDFCSVDNAWLIDYTFAPAANHLGQAQALWVEPDSLHLMALMQQLYQASQTAQGQQSIKAKTALAKATVLQQWTWEQAAKRLLQALDELPQKNALPKPKPTLGWISTWNTRCGIASYSEFLLTYLGQEVTLLANTDCDLVSSDSEQVKRCWATTAVPHASLQALQETIEQGQFTDIIIQFNFGFFHLAQLRLLLIALKAKGINTYIFFHATQDILRNDQPVKSLRQLVNGLQSCKRLFVHSVDDVNRLKRFGLSDNVTLIPHGVLSVLDLMGTPPAKSDVFTIASYGFLLPDKGIPELIAAFVLLMSYAEQVKAQGKPCPALKLNLYNALYPSPLSQLELDKCQRIIELSGYASSISLYNDYQDNRQTLAHLAQSDLIVFPYQKTRESASGAIRLGLASGQPVVCTPLSIFQEVHEIVSFLPGITPQATAQGLWELINNSQILTEKQQKQHQWLQQHAWKNIAERLTAIINQ